MIDIIEAGKFYNDCLKKVHESILQENVLPENKAINAKADLYSFQGGHYGLKAGGVFELNNITYTFNAEISQDDSKRAIIYKVREAIAKVVAKAITNSIDWNEIDEQKIIP